MLTYYLAAKIQRFFTMCKSIAHSLYIFALDKKNRAMSLDFFIKIFET